VEGFEASPEPHLGAVFGAGVRATANAPLRWESRVIGSLGLGTRCDAQAARLRERLPTVREFGVVGAALLGPQLAERERLAAAAARVDGIIAGHAFAPVYQPILDLATGETVGFESLTRFSDRTPPDVHFADAEAAGRGLELEAACLAASIDGAVPLPAGAWLSLNVSPAIVSAPAVLARIIERCHRPLVLEITEHVPIDDYARLVESLRGLGGDVRLAVDDAGAGYAGLRHILEIRPHIVKLDTALVRSVDTDVARQALITSLISFASRTNAVVLAEGVETVREFECLRGMGVTLGQGYLLGRPAHASTWQRLAADIAGDAPAVPDACRAAGGRPLPAPLPGWGTLPFAS
jgi:EAL domain-containing protein (putative c-di-GMP-specific phosphodiesterase class I)